MPKPKRARRRPAMLLCPTMTLGLGLSGSSCGPTPDEIAAGTLAALPFAYLLTLCLLALLTTLWRRSLPEQPDHDGFPWLWHLWVLAPLSALVLVADQAGTWLTNVAVCAGLSFAGITCLIARLAFRGERRVWQRWLPAAFAALIAASQLLVLFGGTRWDTSLGLSQDALLLTGLVLAPIVLVVLLLGALIEWGATAFDHDAQQLRSSASRRD